MNTEQQLVIYRLAHENNMTIDRFLDRLQEAFHIDTSDYPKTQDGSVIYPDGMIGIPLDMPTDEEMKVHQAAELQGISTNAFVRNAVEAAMEEAKRKNPEAFKDSDDKN